MKNMEEFCEATGYPYDLLMDSRLSEVIGLLADFGLRIEIRPDPEARAQLAQERANRAMTLAEEAREMVRALIANPPPGDKWKVEVRGKKIVARYRR